MSYLRNSILATIVYYDIFNYPLTLVEIYKYMINPARIVKIEGGISEVSINSIVEELDKLEISGIIGTKNGFYFLNGRDDIYNLRMQRHKIADQKWKKFLKFVKYLALAPYLRGVFASGSMAINNTGEESDFDILVVAKSGHLYTCRFFLWVISSLAGARRKKHQKIAPDKLCFNHYIADDSLYIPHESIFNAQTYASLKPAMIAPGLIDNFYHANLWLNNYVYNFRPEKEFIRRSVTVPFIFKFIAESVESVLSLLKLDRRIETILRHFQQERIKKDPVTYSSGGRVIFTEQELEFHPYSFERIVINEYNRGVMRLGIVPYIKETDSGLLGVS